MIELDEIYVSDTNISVSGYFIKTKNIMTHESEQTQMFYILKHIDYSQKWEDIEYGLGYDLGDHRFQSDKTYQKVREAAKHLWACLNGHLNSDGNPK